MFRKIVEELNKGFGDIGALEVLTMEPILLSSLLEVSWTQHVDKVLNENARNWRKLPSPFSSPFAQFPLIGSQAVIVDFLRSTDTSGRSKETVAKAKKQSTTSRNTTKEQVEEFSLLPKVLWHHLIYAYLIENTRVVRIFQHIIHKFFHTEEFGTPSEDTQRWLRNTEELFFSKTFGLNNVSIRSEIRKDFDATRRNIYFRMFGMDLNHFGAANNKLNYIKPKAANKNFVGVLGNFLTEVYRGIINADNKTGSNTTDEAAIADYGESLKNMLNVRRLGGNMAREEFFMVAMMSWFHLTLEFNSPIIKDLRAEASSPDERLKKLGERVGIPYHGNSKNLIALADSLSRLLIGIELGLFDDPREIPVLYLKQIDGKENPWQSLMKGIITHWSKATGQDIKKGALLNPTQRSTNGVLLRN